MLFREYLNQELARRAQRNPRYSLRAFARFLGTDFSAFSKMLRGKRPIGPTKIRDFGVRLGLPSEQIEGFIEARRKARINLGLTRLSLQEDPQRLAGLNQVTVPLFLDGQRDAG